MIQAPARKQWSDLTPPQRASVVVMGLIQLALLIAALVDIRRRPAEQIRGKKAVWVGVSFINFVGPLAYFIFGRKH